MSFNEQTIDMERLAQDIKAWGRALGFQRVGITDTDTRKHHAYLEQWLEQGFHGDMLFMEQHPELRKHPEHLHPGTLRIISVRMNYLAAEANFSGALGSAELGFISRYALGRDYHKVLRSRLKQLGKKIEAEVPGLSFRPFSDSAPILEHAIAEKAGLGFTGKHSLTIDPDDGSWFFLGELFINLPLPIDPPRTIEKGCASCTSCISLCPTGAIVAPYRVDARKCISYLTIEHRGEIPIEYRRAMGNRIYGCDDCQVVCPFNGHAGLTEESDFQPRPALKDQPLLALFMWTEADFLRITAGNPIHRIGVQKWRQNIAIALGNYRRELPPDDLTINAVDQALNHYLSTSNDEVLRAHCEWALQQGQPQGLALEETATTDHSSTTRQQRKHQLLIRVIEKGIPRDA